MYIFFDSMAAFAASQKMTTESRLVVGQTLMGFESAVRISYTQSRSYIRVPVIWHFRISALVVRVYPTSPRLRSLAMSAKSLTQ